MNLQTKITLQKQAYNHIDYNSNVLLFGSCFSENIGNKFNYFKFQSSINPFGILFHPLAIETLITRAINKTYYTEDDLFFQNEQWCCLDAHSKFNTTSKTELLKALNSQIDKTYDALHKTTHIFVTLGTSWVYRHIATDAIVANCHKLPQKQFLKELLSVEDSTAALEAIITLVRSINADVNFVFTLSPVRHIKDGFVENARSKAHLLTAIHHVVDIRNGLYYFPSYEIMMDELRDYRFYNEDMLHPSPTAIDYIWNKFEATWLSEDAQKTLQAVTSIQSKKAHRPFNSDSKAHQDFLNKLNLEIKDLKLRHPHICFS